METDSSFSIDSSTARMSHVELVDDSGSSNPSFEGATLQLDAKNEATEKHVPDVIVENGPQRTDSAFDRNQRPGSTMSHHSRVSITSSIRRATKVLSEEMSTAFFSNRNSVFENAVEEAKDKVVKADLDGEVKGAWLLTEIDHWDNEREKLILLCENSVLVLKYDFVTLKLLDKLRRVLLHTIDTLEVGDLTYPGNSLMYAREQGGLRIKWNKGEAPTFAQRWNPMCDTIPWLTLADHPIICNPKENETITYSVEDFHDSLVMAVTAAFNSKGIQSQVQRVEGPIIIESLLNFGSLIFNQSSLGFNRDRNGLSF